PNPTREGGGWPTAAASCYASAVTDGAFFTRDGDRFVASELVRGPWDPRFAHGGPPSALLAREAERLGREHGAPHVARLTIDLLRAVPITTLEVRSEVVRAGKSALVVALSL